MVAVFGSKRRGPRTEAQRDKDQNHGAPGYFGIRGLTHFWPPGIRWRGLFYAQSRSRRFFSIFSETRGTNDAARRYPFVVQLFGGEPWSPGNFGFRGLLVYALEIAGLDRRQLDPP